jgi:thioredoxin reductase
MAIDSGSGSDRDRYDVVIVGGGPGGLAAALTLGRARKRVLVCDGGPRRNAAADHMHNFVTRDGTPPAEFRRIGRAQLEPYPGVELRDEPVTAITGERDRFEVALASGVVRARRILLCTGMIDEPPAIDGLRPLWGTSIIICPYCHGWEIRDQRWGYLAAKPEALEFPLLLRGWTADLVVFTDGKFEVPAADAARLAAAGIRIEPRRIARLAGTAAQLERVELADGDAIARDALFLHPRQRQVGLVEALGLALSDAGFVRVDETRRETSIPGIYAGGDLITGMQSAIGAAAAAVHAAAVLNHELTVAGAPPATPPA